MTNQPTPIPANAAAMTALANQVILGRLSRAVANGTTTSGRTKVRFEGPLTPAEITWESIRAEREVRAVVTGVREAARLAAQQEMARRAVAS